MVVRTVHELFSGAGNVLVDWTTLGMVAAAVFTKTNP